MNIHYSPIGYFETEFRKLTDMPIQPAGAREIEGRIVIDKEFEAGLKDLDGFSHIIVLSHFHASSGFKLHVKPFLDDTLRGVFSTRAPRRPNSIGLSILQLVRVEGNRLTVKGVDLLDGTPVLDIKPYVADFDCCGADRFGWLEGKSELAANRKSDDRFRD